MRSSSIRAILSIAQVSLDLLVFGHFPVSGKRHRAGPTSSHCTKRLLAGCDLVKEQEMMNLA